MAQNINVMAFVCLVASFSGSGHAQQPAIQYQPERDAPFGARNAQAPDQTSQFDFVIGAWDVTIDYRPPGGQTTQYQARWHNYWMVDGVVVAQEWRGPYSTGLELRRFNGQTGRWEGQNTYTFASGWTRTEAEWVEGEMIVYLFDGVDAAGEFINRETYYEISEDRFRMRSQRSYDHGETWNDWVYDMVCIRRVEP